MAREHTINFSKTYRVRTESTKECNMVGRREHGGSDELKYLRMVLSKYESKKKEAKESAVTDRKATDAYES